MCIYFYYQVACPCPLGGLCRNPQEKVLLHGGFYHVLRLWHYDKDTAVPCQEWKNRGNAQASQDCQNTARSVVQERIMPGFVWNATGPCPSCLKRCGAGRGVYR